MLDVPASHRLVDVRRHDHLAVRAEEHPVRAPCEIAGCRSHGSGTKVDELHAVLHADRRGETVRADGECGRDAGLDLQRPRLLAAPEIPPRQLTVLGRGDERAIVRCERELSGTRTRYRRTRRRRIPVRSSGADRLQRGGVSDRDLRVGVAEALCGQAGATRATSCDPSFVNARPAATPSTAISASCARVRASMRRTSWSPPTASVRPSGLYARFAVGARHRQRVPDLLVGSRVEEENPRRPCQPPYARTASVFPSGLTAIPLSTAPSPCMIPIAAGAAPECRRAGSRGSAASRRSRRPGGRAGARGRGPPRRAPGRRGAGRTGPSPRRALHRAG